MPFDGGQCSACGEGTSVLGSSPSSAESTGAYLLGDLLRGHLCKYVVGPLSEPGRILPGYQHAEQGQEAGASESSLMSGVAAILSPNGSQDAGVSILVTRNRASRVASCPSDRVRFVVAPWIDHPPVAPVPDWTST